MSRLAKVIILLAAAAAARPRRRRGLAMTDECRAVLTENNLDWLLEPFTCSARMKTSPAEMVLGTGLGDTGTRSVAAAIDALGIPTCHRTYTTADLLLNSSRYDFSAFERAGARAYFDTPMAFLWPRLACAYPNYKIVHTTRLHYSRHFGGDHCDGRGARKYEREESIVRCLDYGTYCPQGDETLEAFLDNERRIQRVPSNRVYVMNCVEINQCVGCTRQYFTKSFLGDDAAVLARSSGEEPASPRRRAGVASMAWRTTRRFRLTRRKTLISTQVMNISDAEATFDYQRLARFLGRPIPASREIPRFKHNRCSVDGVLKGPWSSATDRDKIRVTEECDSLLRAHGMHHLVKPFTCSPDMKVSDAEMVLGSGFGATGTRSVAAAVDALGIPTCHKFDKYVELLNLTRNDPTDVGIFAQFGPRAFFDTPMATLWPRLACAFPNYKLVHTTRSDYHRHYDEAYCAQERKWKTGHVFDGYTERALGRCLEYGTACPKLEDSRAAFEANELMVSRVPADRRIVFNISDLSTMSLHALARFLDRPTPAGWDAWTVGMPRWHHNFCTGTERGTTSLDVGHHVAPGKYAGPWWPGRNVSFPAPPEAPVAVPEPSVAEPVNFTRTKPGLFLMFASARCGSDWLADMLQKHPRVCMQYGETGQHSDEVGHNVDSHALVGSYDIERLLATNGDIGAAYAAAAAYRLSPDHRNKHYRPTCDRIGWKQSALWIGGVRLTATHAQRESFARWIRDAGVRVLLLRRDGLAWEVSKQRKKLTDGLDGGSHCQDAKCAEEMAREKITLDPGKILELLDGAKQSWDHVEAWARQSLDPSRTLLVRYEDLVNATFRFLGVKPVQATSSFVKTSRGRTEDLIANVDEVRAALNGTRWAF